MKKLFLSLQAYAPADVNRIGVYRYAELKDFHVVLICYAVDDGECRIVDIAHGEQLPTDVRDAISDPAVMKIAFDAAYVRVCLSRYLGFESGTYLPPEQWFGIWPTLNSLALDAVFTELADHLPKSMAPEIAFKDYCRGETILTYREYLDRMKPDSPRLILCRRMLEMFVTLDQGACWILDEAPAKAERNAMLLCEHINDRGVAVDRELVRNAAARDRQMRAHYASVFRQLTGLETLDRRGFEAWKISQDVPPDCTDGHAGILPEKVRTAMKAYSILMRTGSMKYQNILNGLGDDDRLRGLYVYRGARNGRFGNAIVQTDNLPVSRLSELTLTRTLMKEGLFADLETLCPNTEDVLPELMSTAFIPKNGHKIVNLTFDRLEQAAALWLKSNGGKKCWTTQVNEMLKTCMEKPDCFRLGCLVIDSSEEDISILLPSGRTVFYDHIEPIWDKGIMRFRYCGRLPNGKRGTLETNAHCVASDLAQNVARDLVVHVLVTMETEGYPVVMIRPNGLVLEVPESADCQKLCACADRPPQWAKGLSLPLRVYESQLFLELSTDTCRKN